MDKADKGIRTIDASGLSCPQPALLTRQALSSMSGGTVKVLVDSVTARDNVTRIAGKAGWTATIEERAGGSFQLTLTK